MYTTHYDQSLCASGFCRRRAWLSKQLNISQHRLPCNQTRNQMYRREGNAKPTGTHSVNFVLSRSWLIVLTYTTGCSEKHWNAVRKFPQNRTLKFATIPCRRQGCTRKLLHECTTTFLAVWNDIKSCFECVLLIPVLVRTNILPSPTF